MRSLSTIIPTILLALLASAVAFSAEGLFGPPVVYKANAHSILVLPLDIDDNELEDLLVVCGEPEIAYIYYNDGFGLLDSLTSFAAGDFPSAACAADFDGDQDLDIALTDRGWARILLYRNEGAGNFLLTDSIPAGGEALDVTTADLNNDSYPDLVVADPWWSLVLILLNDGDGGFGQLLFKQIDSTPVAVYTADLDGDSNIDIISTNYLNNGLALLRNSGDGIMDNPVYLQFEGTCQMAIAVDLDNDYDKDLVVAVSDTLIQRVEVFINQSDLVFTEGGEYTLDQPAWLLTAADFNSDGYLDIAAGCHDPDGDQDIAILLNSGTATFEPPTYVEGLWVTSSLAATDLDLDGDQDLLVVSAWDSTFAVLYNTSVVASCGDVNVDGKVNLDDAVSLLGLIFAGATYPGPPAAADVDCNQRLNLGDAAYLLAYLLAGGPPPCDNCP
ncbi:MAG: VCBS repeat-containing protein [bacterium]